MRSPADIAASLSALRSVRSATGVRLISDNGLLPYLQAYNDRDKTQPVGSPSAGAAIIATTASQMVKDLLTAYAGYALALKAAGVTAIDTHGGAGPLAFAPDEARAAALAFGATAAQVDEATTRYRSAPGSDLPVLGNVTATASAPTVAVIPPSTTVAAPAVIAPVVDAVQTAVIVAPPGSGGGGGSANTNTGIVPPSAMIVPSVPVVDLPTTTIYTQAVDADAATGTSSPAATTTPAASGKTDWQTYVWWGVALAIVAYVASKWWK